MSLIKLYAKTANARHELRVGERFADQAQPRSDNSAGVEFYEIEDV
jgi:hypothetical protein